MDQSAPKTVGSYTLLAELGSGGQGTVWLAEDHKLRRRVALKMLHAGPGSLSADRLARFRREAESVSKLDHPNICALLDAGEAEGTAWLAFRFVEGTTLAQWIASAVEQRDGGATTARPGSPDHASSDPGSREGVLRLVGLFEKLARALHKAHERGLIHRDVKPGNVMITPEEEPVLLDFGLARDELAVDQSLTHSGDLLGTPAYMSPEQLMAHRVPLDRRTDVYSLGTTLYEALTLQRPFSALTRAELYQRILHSEATTASSLNRQIPRDLQVVLQTAMEKDRNRRYQTAQDFAEDLRRFRQFEAIHARPIGRWLRLRRWGQRHPAAAVTIGALALLLAVVSGSLWQQGRTLEHTKALALASASALAADSDQMLALRLAREAMAIKPTVETRSALHEALANATERVRIEHAADVFSAQWSADGSRILTASNDGTARISTAEGRMVGKPLQHESRAWSAVFSPLDENQVLTACDDGFYVWSVEDGSKFKLPGVTHDVFPGWARASYSRDGRWILTWQTNCGGSWIGDAGGSGKQVNLGVAIQHAEFLPDGSAVAYAVPDGRVRFWDWQNGREPELPRPPEHPVPGLHWIGFSRDGHRMLLGGQGVFRVHAQDGNLPIQAIVRGGDTWNADVNDEGWFVGGSADHVVRLFDPDGALATTYRGHTMHSLMTAFSPGGRKIVTTSADGTARVWDVCVPEAPVLRGHTKVVRSVAFLPGRTGLVTGSHDGTVRIWKEDGSCVRTLSPWREPGAGVEQIAVSGSGRWVAAAGDAGCAILDLGTGTSRILPHRGYVPSACFSPTDENVVVTAGIDGRVRSWDVAKGQEGPWSAEVSPWPRFVAFSPDGRTLAVCAAGASLGAQVSGSALLFDLDAGSNAVPREFGEDVWSAAFHGDCLLTAESARIARLWDLRTGEPLEEYGPHESQVMVAVFSPEGDRILTVSRGRSARLWSRDGTLLAILRGHMGNTWHAAFSPDGKRVATTSYDRTARIWIVDDAALIEAAKYRQLPVRPEQLEPYRDLLGDRVLVTK